MLQRLTILVAVLYACLILYGCATHEKGKCLRWSTIETKKTHCTRSPYRVCFDEVTEQTVCIDREKEK